MATGNITNFNQQAIDQHFWYPEGQDDLGQQKLGSHSGAPVV